MQATFVCISQLSCLCAARPSSGKIEPEPSFRFKLHICLWIMRVKPLLSENSSKMWDTSPFSWSPSLPDSALGWLLAENQNGLVLLATGNEDFRKPFPIAGRVCAIRANCSGDLSFRRLKNSKLRKSVEEQNVSNLSYLSVCHFLLAWDTAVQLNKQKQISLKMLIICSPRKWEGT